jgi:calcium permeable stress-gated cation channel
LHDFRKIDDKFVLQHQSLDGYLFLRFFKIIIFICFAGCCITWPILFSINATGGGNASQLDKLTFGNVNQNDRLYAHAVVAWLFLGRSLIIKSDDLLISLSALIIVVVTREQLFLVGARQAHLSSKSNVSRLSPRVVLFLFAPREALGEEQLQESFGNEAQKSWVVSDISQLENLVSERNDTAMRLEAAEVQLSRKANKRRLEKARGQRNGGTSEHGDEATFQVPNPSRPKHKSTPVGGNKLDTIEWGRKTLPDLQRRVQEEREAFKEPSKPKSSAVFVAYSSPAAAQRAYLEVKFHPIVSRVAPDRFIGVQPKEALWNNLTLTPPNRISRASLATVLVVATILFWAIPIGIVGAISNINYLTDKVKFLQFLNKLPPSVIGLISGLLPPLAISTLVSYVPKIFRCAYLNASISTR